jgi:multiple antibiotic resistance protein
MVEQLIKFFVVFFVVVEPISLVPMFAALSEGMSAPHRRKTAGKAVLLAGAILVVFALAGDWFLKSMGISLHAFRIFGGLMLFLIALDMIFVRNSGARTATENERDEASQRQDIFVFPLAFPFIAGPGALATILLATGEVPRFSLLFAGLIAVVVLVLVLTWLFMLATPMVMRVMGVTGANVISRLTGVILGALAVQYVIDGVRGALATH